MEFIFNLLEFEIETPTTFGWFHIMFLLITILVTVLFIIKFKNPTEKFINRIFLIAGLLMFVLECYKQFVFTFSYEAFEVISDYQWYSFPFQFCSVPMYVYLIIPFTKGKVRNALLCFSASYSLFAGTAVMIYPGDVFIATLGISIQTMIHHGLMVVMGVYLLVSRIVKVSIKTILSATVVFSIVLLIALLMNLTVIKFIPSDETFNMFFISPYFDCTLPILSIIYKKVPYIIFLFIYVFGFGLVAGLVNLIYYGIDRLVVKINVKQKSI